MQKVLRTLSCAVSWTLTALAGVLELTLLWLWRRGVGYVDRFGAVENPYAAEKMELAGGGALLLLPLLGLLLIWAVWSTRRIMNNGQTPEEEK